MSNKNIYLSNSILIRVSFVIVLSLTPFCLHAQSASVDELFITLEKSNTANKDTFKYYLDQIESHPDFAKAKKDEVRLYRWKGKFAFDSKEYDLALKYYSKAMLFIESNKYYGEQYAYSGVLRSKIAIDSSFRVLQYVGKDISKYKSKNDEMYAYLCDEVASHYYYNGENIVADSFSSMAVYLAKKNGLSKELTYNIYNNRFVISFNLSRNPYLSTFYCKENLRLAKELNDESKVQSARFHLANNYMEIGEMGKAIETYFGILSYYESQQDYFGMAKTYSNIGHIQQQGTGENANRKAIETLKKSLACLHKEDHAKINGERNHVTPYLVLSYIYDKTGNCEQAFVYVDSAYKIATNENIAIMIPYSLQKRARVLSKLDRNEEAEKGFKECLDIYTKRKVSGKVARVHMDYGNHLLGMNKVPKAILHFKKALKLGKGSQALEKDCYLGLATASKIIGNFKSESQYNEKYITLKDALAAKESLSEIETAQMKYEYLQSEAKREKELLEIENKKKITKARMQFLAWGGFLVAVILGSLVVFLYLRSRDRRQFNQMIAQKNTELTELNHQLSDSNSKLNDFAHVVAHDIRSPLISIKLYSSILNQEGLGNKKKAEYLAYISEGVDDLNTMLKSVLEFSKFKNAIKFENVNLEELLNQLLQILKFELEKEEVNVTLQLDLKTFNSSPELLKQVFINIVGNGIKYSNPNRKSEITIASKKLKEKVGEQSNILISIQDNGLGIKKEDTQIIFKPFKKVKQNDTNSYGIGLANCARIIESLSGSIWVESVVGEGSTFFIKLPIEV